MNESPTAVAFRATIELGGKPATTTRVVEVPPDLARRRIANAVELPRAGRT